VSGTEERRMVNRCVTMSEQKHDHLDLYRPLNAQYIPLCPPTHVDVIAHPALSFVDHLTADERHHHLYLTELLDWYAAEVIGKGDEVGGFPNLKAPLGSFFK